MCEINDRVAGLVQLLAATMDWTIVPESAWAYSLLIIATDTPLDRALTYLRDCGGSPESAKGRLLLRAAERALRAAGNGP